MQTLSQLIKHYRANHTNKNAQLAHMIAGPILLFALLIFFGWLHISVPTIFDITLAGVLSIALLAYYFALEWSLALMLTPVVLLLNLLAKLFSQPHPNTIGIWMFLLLLVIGGGVAVFGSLQQKNQLSLYDSAWQLLVIPLELTLVALNYFGFYKDFPKTK